MEQTSSRGMIIKNIYLHLVSFVALMMIVTSTATIINDVLKTYVFIGEIGILIRMRQVVMVQLLFLVG
jgi:hypothetical protein